MKEYETMFVIRPDGPESQANELLKKTESIIARHKGVILRKSNLGKRELAYQIGKYRQGVYYHYDYAGEPGVVDDLERSFRLHDLPLRYLTVKLSDTVDVEARKKELEGEKAEAIQPVEKKISEMSEADDEEVNDA